MPGNGSLKRSHADAVRAANMKAEGCTTREISEAIGKAPDRVKAIVLLGERLKQADPSTDKRS